MPEEPNNLADRVDDIEKTIGDLDQTFQAIKDCLDESVFQPTCPPYCAHGVNPEYVDERTMQEQVSELARHIGDLAAFLECVKNALAVRPQPTCPPYCAHESGGNVEQSGA
jgi:hypothetical protein